MIGENDRDSVLLSLVFQTEILPEKTRGFSKLQVIYIVGRRRYNRRIGAAPLHNELSQRVHRRNVQGAQHPSATLGPCLTHSSPQVEGRPVRAVCNTP